MSATINAFPPLHAFSSRHWTLIVIAALHLAVFWLINSEMSPGFVRRVIDEMTVVVPYKSVEPAPQPQKPIEPKVNLHSFVPSPPPLTTVPLEDTSLLEPVFEVAPTPPAATESPSSRESVIAEPQIDPRIGLSEPTYPSTEIRLGHEGTVLLSVYVLENGRVGEVRIDQTSGYPRLDAAAAREARRWRLKPGMRDGIPIPMWKQIPITYQLREGTRTLRY